ncbi:unnamed protein product [Caenorhabditis bovis]|uniref:Uncharacterized protein n=1 Tax=Caenorhabditis bovis TaxID=2654633 RepID=A0A8S1EB66_9PELO|nr:unnamed protein product [Caenorhabditis bovis]
MVCKCDCKNKDCKCGDDCKCTADKCADQCGKTRCCGKTVEMKCCKDFQQRLPYANKGSILDTLLGPPTTQLPPMIPEEVMNAVGKKHKFGISHPTRNNECSNGWCGVECCHQTTIEATALPGSFTPPHPLVLVVHPAPAPLTCIPACQPLCHPECVHRLKYQVQQPHYPICRPDCMPACHVDCLIIPPERVKCYNYHCQCSPGYVPCAAFTCCMRYPNMVAKMKSNVKNEIENETHESESVEDEDQIFQFDSVSLPHHQHSPRKNVIVKLKPIYYTATNSNPYSRMQTRNTSMIPFTVPRRSTTTIAPVLALRPDKTTTSTIPITTTETPTKTTIRSTPTATSVTNMIRQAPVIAALAGKRHPVGDIRGRHVIRSENFLDVLSELAQVKLKEDINQDLTNAATIIDFMTDNIQ